MMTCHVGPAGADGGAAVAAARRAAGLVSRGGGICGMAKKEARRHILVVWAAGLATRDDCC